MAEISGHHSLAAPIPFCDLLIFRFYAFRGRNPNNSGFNVLQAWLKHMLSLHMLSVKDLFLQEDIFFYKCWYIEWVGESWNHSLRTFSLISVTLPMGQLTRHSTHYPSPVS